MSKEQILTLENTTFHFDEAINGFKVKNDVLVPKFTYNVKEKQGNGNYILTNSVKPVTFALMPYNIFM